MHLVLATMSHVDWKSVKDLENSVCNAMKEHKCHNHSCSHLNIVNINTHTVQLLCNSDLMCGVAMGTVLRKLWNLNSPSSRVFSSALVSPPVLLVHFELNDRHQTQYRTFKTAVCVYWIKTSNINTCTRRLSRKTHHLTSNCFSLSNDVFIFR